MCIRIRLKDELHGMTYLMELIDFEIKEAQARIENEGAVGTSHLLNLSNQQVCSFVHLL